MLARYIGRYLPGNPTRIVENMTGAAGIIAANHLYNRVKPDGFTIGAWASPLILQHIMGNEAVQFDGRRFGYLGIPSEYDTVCTFNQQSGITKMDDWINAKRPQKISTIGPGTSTSDIPKLLKAALNLPMDVIDGYKGGADARLAVESGEVDGYCGSWGTLETVWRAAYESKKIVPVLQAAPKSQSKYKHIPLASSYAKTEEARELIKVGDDVHGAQFVFSVPPGMAKDRLESTATRLCPNIQRPGSFGRSQKIATGYRAGGRPEHHEDSHGPLRSQAGDDSEAEGYTVAEEEVATCSWFVFVIVGGERRENASRVRAIISVQSAAVHVFDGN